MGGKVVGFGVSCVMAGFLASVSPVAFAIGQSVAVGTLPEKEAKTPLVSLNVKNEPVERVLKMIAQQVGLKVMVPAERVPSAARVTLQMSAVTATEAFARVLVGTGLRARVVGGTVLVSDVASVSAAPMVQGNISGKVVDGKTHQGLRGATISISGTEKGTTTSDDGSFRLSGVVSGSYTIHARMLGYVKTTKTVTITDGQTASVDFALEPSVNALDQVIVTGTVVATAQREVPNAMTVITAKDIEQRGITKIDQLFRGDVPGVFAMNMGSTSPLDQVVIFSRGATALSDASAGTGVWGTNPMKTYVDGVELADPQWLSQLDPKSIERIEIVTGPQASTIYGSNAINGVMQVFTKRGSSARPQLTATLLSGWVENNVRSTRTAQHDDAAQVTGVEGHWAYNAGGSWNYLGPWTPGKQTSRLSGFGGARVQRGSITADGSLRLATTQTRQGGDYSQVDVAFRARGWYSPTGSDGRLGPRTQTLLGRTLGLSLGLAPMSWWSHELVLGVDASAKETRGIARGFMTPSDSLLSLTQSMVDLRSLRYASTVQVPLAHLARAIVTVGADAWQSLSTSLDVRALALTGTLTPSGAPTVTRQPGHNAGGFLQTQVGLWDQLFMTYGLRAEWNPTYGDATQPNWAPRYGLAYTRDIETRWGVVTAKLRGSYGRSTRPPAVGAKVAKTATAQLGASAGLLLVPYYGDYDYVLANSELGPEHQQGGEGGLELYFGRRGSLVVTRYNQMVEQLIAQPRIDSVRSKDPNIRPLLFVSCDAERYCYYLQFQNLNVGNIRNQGWEFQGTIVTGPLTMRGVYSWTKSRTIGVNPKYRAFFTPAGYPQYQPGASFRYLPEHTWSGSVTYARSRSTIALNLSGIGMLTSLANAQFNTSISSNIRLMEDRVRLNTGSYAMLNAGYVLADLNASQRFSPRVEGVMQVQNLGDMYRNDYNASVATLGRQTKLGLRLRY